jgi:hypothetical protein
VIHPLIDMGRPAAVLIPVRVFVMRTGMKQGEPRNWFAPPGAGLQVERYCFLAG